MRDFAVLSPVVLLLLMLLLGRFERWLNTSAPEPPTRSERRRWRPAPRSVRTTGATTAGRRLAHRARSAARRRPTAAAPRASAPVPGGRRPLLGGRLRSRH